MSSTQQEKAKQRRAKFAALLRDMFQLDEPELDFGLYRIMHAKKDEIDRFIEQDLPKQAQEAFKSFADQDKAQLEQAIKEARQAATAAGFNPDESPKVKELEAQYNTGFDTAREEGEVYDALVTFFSRYYDQGDFISQRRYGDGTYAIPYDGEEVVLHWANKDQYYIKSSEHLRDYAFKLSPQATAGEDPRRVHFKLVDASAGAKDNNKEADDRKRQFVLDAEQPFEFITGEPDAGGNSYQELVCRFEFRPATVNDWEESVKASATAAAKKKAPTQEHLLDIAEVLLLGDGSELGTQWKSALSKPYRKANGELADYSTLKGQLNNYTKKNSLDYFIHKDLGGFLTRELDFYIKNELMQWEDLVALKNNPARLAPMLSKLDVIRDLGGKIIAFLAQLENFQKKLWLKKKFVTETNYCITLDRVPEELYPAICDNQAQLEEWIKLFAIDEIKGDLTTPAFSNPLTPEFLQANQNLVLDTQFFSEQFKAELVASIEDFDEQCDGLLVHSENFQALNLLQERYKEQVKCIYIDPPYNTGEDGFTYKDSYQNSSWITMMSDRTVRSYTHLSNEGVFLCSIDDYELNRLHLLMQHNFGDQAWEATFIRKRRSSSSMSQNLISQDHEYVVCYTKNLFLTAKGIPKQYTSYRNPDNDPRGPWTFGDLTVGMDSSMRPNQYYDLISPFTGKPYPANPNRVWSYIPDSMQQKIQEGKVAFPDDPSLINLGINISGPMLKRFKSELKSDVNPISTLIETGKGKEKGAVVHLFAGLNTQATKEIQHIFGGNLFNYAKPTSLVSILIDQFTTANSNIVLDYFAGSGTTGHAVINLNRVDNCNRKYILVEMGDYFDTVLKPRMAKVVYASDWKNGKPVARNTGISHCFKYIRLESYEDTLGNLTLNTKQDLFSQASNDDARQAYVMNYMLDVETRGSQSLLNIEQFTNPTEYQLNVRSASGDETVPVKVDLLETFNYLLGLEVEHIAAPMHFDAEITTGEYGRKQAKVKHTTEGKWWFRTVYGKNRNGQYVLVVWRNLPSVIEAGSDAEKRTEALITDNAVLDAVLVERLKIRLTESPDDEIDILYVNGDNNIAIPRDRQGNPMEQARVQLIEDAFKRLMFADTDAVH